MFQHGNIMMRLNNYTAESKVIQLLAVVPFIIYIIADFASNEGSIAPQWAFWVMLIYGFIITPYFRKQLYLLGGLRIMWTVLGIVVLITLNAFMNWDLISSLVPMLFVIIHIEMCLFLPRKKEFRDAAVDKGNELW